MRRAFAVALLAMMAFAQPVVSGAPRELPLGMAGLPESRSSQRLTHGVTYTRIDRGYRSNIDYYTVDVEVTESTQRADEVAADLRAKGYDARIGTVPRAQDDPRPEPAAYVVRSGNFETQAAADQRAAELRSLGYSGARTVYSAQTGAPTTGPFVVHVLTIEPDKYDGTIVPELATEIVPEREKLTDMARRNGAFAGINAGYFVIGEQDGTPGDLAGISAIGGTLISEAVNGRTSLLVRPDGAGADIAALATDTEARVGGRRFLADGFNREPGEIRSCGGVGGDTPTEQPKHDFTCADTSELIVFSEAFGATTPPGPGAEVIVDRAGRVVEVHPVRGGAIPPGGLVLSATGDNAALLLKARPGQRASVSATISEGGRNVALDGGLGIVNGGPRLLRAGQPDVTAYGEGFVWLDDPAFWYRFGAFRHPRTLAGVTRAGEILLVAIDGRQFDYSVGASFEEEAGVMQALGAVEAVNLDGGGSTTLVIDDQLVNRPSDTTGERPIGDALLLFDR